MKAIKSLCYLGVLATWGGVGGSVEAADYSWTKTGTASNWSTSGNWTPGGPPGSGDSIISPVASPSSIYLDFNSASITDWTYGSASNQIVYGGYGTGSTSALTVTGNLSKSGAGMLTFNNHVSLPAKFLDLNVSGQVSVSEGTLAVAGSSFTAGSAALSGGILQFTNAGTRAITGNLDLSGTANVRIIGQGATAPPVQNGTLSVGSLSGTGGSIQVNANGVNGHIGNLVINTSAGTSTYAGTIIKGGAPNVLNVEKNNAGTQIFTGTNNYTGTTVINGGSLLVNGVHTAAGAYTASGGTLGGSGSITTAGNANITISGTGKLSPGGGADNSLAASLGTGTLDLSGISTGALVFELGTAGDVFTLTTGTLAAGILNFNEFSFSQGGGFTTTTYKLFDLNSAMTGALGTLSGSLGPGYSGLLFIGSGADANDIMLTVSAVPEPSTYALLAGGGLLWMIWGRRKSARV